MATASALPSLSDILSAYDAWYRQQVLVSRDKAASSKPAAMSDTGATAATGPTAAEGAQSGVSMGKAAAAGATALGLTMGNPAAAFAAMVSSALSQAANSAFSSPGSPPDASPAEGTDYSGYFGASDAGDSAGGEGSGSGSVAGGDFAGYFGGEGGDPGGGSGEGGAGGSGDGGGGEGGGGAGDGGGDGGWKDGGEPRAMNSSQMGTDRIPIHVTQGEYVLPVDVVKHIGKGRLDEIVRRIHGRVGGQNGHFDDGGGIDPLSDPSVDPSADPSADPNFDPNADPNAGDPYSSAYFDPNTAYGDPTSQNFGLLDFLKGAGSSLISNPGLMRLLGTGLSTGLGVVGSKQQQNQLNALAQQYTGFGGPSRARYDASFLPGFSMMGEPGYADALNSTSDSLLRRLSTQGNPFGNPGGLIEANKAINSSLALPALQQYRNQNAATGGYGAFSSAAPGAATGAIGAGANVYNALGAGISDITNPQPSLAQLLAGMNQNQVKSQYSF